MKLTSPGRVSLALMVALLAWFGLLLQCFLSLQLAQRTGKTLGSGLVNFFGYFTVLTNLLLSISLTAALAAPRSAAGKYCSRPSLLGAAATSIAFVSLSYHFLLRNVWDPQGPQLLADLLLHYIVPLAYLGYWWIESPRGTAPRWTDPAWWLSYPTAYFAFALIRGKLISTYPYPFIDAGKLGYARTFVNGGGLLLVFYALGVGLVAVDRWRRRSRS